MRVSPGASGRLLIALAAVLSLGLPALARPISAELTEKFARGAYLEAAEAGEATGEPDDLAFAARSLLAACMTGTGEPDAGLIERASRDAEAALRLEPDHEEARLQLAIAVSLKSRSMDLMAAWSAGYGDKGKKLAEAVLRTDPRNVYAHGFLAVWNVEVERRGGDMGAWMLGASLEAARRHYDAARSLAPDDVGVHWQYARALAALDLKAHMTEVETVLTRAVSAVVSDHVEEVMQARAKRLASAIAGNTDAAQKLARALL